MNDFEKQKSLAFQEMLFDHMQEVSNRTTDGSKHELKLHVDEKNKIITREDIQINGERKITIIYP